MKKALFFLVFLCFYQGYSQDIDVGIEVRRTDGISREVYVVGDKINVFFSVTNNGTEEITDLSVVTIFPPNFVVFFPDGTEVPNRSSRFFSSIPPGETVTQESAVYEIVGTGTFLIELESEETDDSAEQEIIVLKQSDLRIVKEVSTNYTDGFVNERTQVGINEIVDYRMSVYNSGPNSAENFKIIDTLPEGLTYVSSNRDGVYNSAENTVSWEVANLEADTTTRFRVQARTNDLGVYTNRAGIENTDQFDADRNNDFDSIEIEVIAYYDLALGKSIVLGSDDPQEGDLVEFILSLTNDDKVSVVGPITIEDLIPNGFTLIATDLDPSLDFDPSTNILTWTILDGIERAGSIQVSFFFQINVNDGDLNYTNTARITSDLTFDTEESNNVASAGITPQTNPDLLDLAISQTVSTSYPSSLDADVGEAIEFTVTVENKGIQMAGESVVVSVSIPDGFNVFDYDVNTITVSDNLLTYTLSNMESGQTESFSFSAEVLVDKSSYSQEASIDFDDDVLSNNVSVIEINPIPVSDLEIQQTVSNTIDRSGRFFVGDTVLVSIRLRNLGPSFADPDITVFNGLPQNLRYISSTPEAELIDLGQILYSWFIDGLAVNEEENFEIRAIVESSGFLGIRSAVTGETKDPDLTNNVAIETEFVAEDAVDIEIDLSYQTTERPQIGDLVNFEILIENKGPSIASDLEITNYIPSGLRVEGSAISDSGRLEGNTIVWDIASLGLSPDDSRLLTFDAQIIAGDNYTDQVELTASALPDIDSSPDSRIQDHPLTLEDDEAEVRVDFKPFAVDDTYTLIQNTSGIFEILINDDFGIDGPGEGTIKLISTPDQGLVTVEDQGTLITQGDDTFLYIPEPSFFGELSFIYEISDLDGDSDQAVVTLIIVEDFDGDGVSGESDLDSDNDGILNSVEGDSDFDGDGLVNSRDLDSDGDGILDAIEAQNGFTGHSGEYNEQGIDLVFGSGISNPVDSDGDGLMDYLDSDSDGDSILDNVENFDFDEDGFMDFNFSRLDIDQNGLDDRVQEQINYQSQNFYVLKDISSLVIDTDLDSLENFRDSDDDGDGKLTVEEDFNGDQDLTNDDCDEDGVVDYLDPDTCEIELIKGISPGILDGINDEFKIDGLVNLYPDFELKIFSRWGNSVFEYRHDGDKFSEAIWWNGLDQKGNKVEEGTYYYLLDYNKGDKKVTKNWVYVKW